MQHRYFAPLEKRRRKVYKFFPLVMCMAKQEELRCRELEFDEFEPYFNVLKTLDRDDWVYIVHKEHGKETGVATLVRLYSTPNFLPGHQNLSGCDEGFLWGRSYISKNNNIEIDGTRENIFLTGYTVVVGPELELANLFREFHKTNRENDLEKSLETFDKGFNMLIKKIPLK